MRHLVATVDEAIAWLATRSHGVVTRPELLAAGITLAEIRQRLGTGALIREYPGVYRVGHRAPSDEATYLAAVRAGGEGAHLCGRAAAYLYGLVKRRPPKPELLLLRRRRIAGVATRRTRHIDWRDSTEHRGIPITTVPRTIVDLAAELPPDELARACHEATVRYRVTPEAIEAVLARRRNSPGARNLRRVLWGDVHVTLSRLETRFLELLAQEGLPLPETNRPVGAHYVDCHWPERRLTVRARQLSLPQLASCLGARPPARAGGARPRRRLPSLHVRRRLRAVHAHAARTGSSSG